MNAVESICLSEFESMILSLFPDIMIYIYIYIYNVNNFTRYIYPTTLHYAPLSLHYIVHSRSTSLLTSFKISVVLLAYVVGFSFLRHDLRCMLEGVFERFFDVLDSLLPADEGHQNQWALPCHTTRRRNCPSGRGGSYIEGVW